MYPLTLGISDSQIIPGLADAYLAKVIAVGGSLTTTEENAVIQLVDDLTAAGIIDKFDILLPILGGTSASSKINLFDPNNTLYDWDYLGTPTFSSTGIKGNGTDGAVRSLWKINDLVKAQNDDVHCSIYSKYYSGGDTIARFNGTLDTAAPLGYAKMMVSQYYGSYGGMYSNSFDGVWSPAYADFEGLAFAYDNGTNQKFYYENVQRGSTTASDTPFTDDSGFALLGLYWYVQNASHVYTERSNDEIRSFSIGSYLNDTQRTDFYDAIVAYQTTLGRNI